MTSPQRDALYAVLNRGAAHGYPMDTVLNSVLEREPLPIGMGTEAPDAAAWLATSLAEWLSTRTENPYSAPASVEPVVDQADPAAPVIDELDGLIQTRVNTLADLAIATRPSWTQEHGSEPDDADGHRGWRAEIAAHAARIDYTQGPTHAPRPEPSPARGM